VSLSITIPVGSACTLMLPAQLGDLKLGQIEDTETQTLLSNDAQLGAGIYRLEAKYAASE